MNQMGGPAVGADLPYLFTIHGQAWRASRAEIRRGTQYCVPSRRTGTETSPTEHFQPEATDNVLKEAHILRIHWDLARSSCTGAC
jgi:hypothetical protein